MSIPFSVCVDISNEIEKVDELVNKPTPSRFNLRIIANVVFVILIILGLDIWNMASNDYVRGEVQDVHLYLLKSEDIENAKGDAKLEVKLYANTQSFFHGARVHTSVPSASSDTNTMCSLSCHGDKQNTQNGISSFSLQGQGFDLNPASVLSSEQESMTLDVRAFGTDANYAKSLFYGQDTEECSATTLACEISYDIVLFQETLGITIPNRKLIVEYTTTSSDLSDWKSTVSNDIVNRRRLADNGKKVSNGFASLFASYFPGASLDLAENFIKESVADSFKYLGDRLAMKFSANMVDATSLNLPFPMHIHVPEYHMKLNRKGGDSQPVEQGSGGARKLFSRKGPTNRSLGSIQGSIDEALDVYDEIKKEYPQLGNIKKINDVLKLINDVSLDAGFDVTIESFVLDLLTPDNILNGDVLEVYISLNSECENGIEELEKIEPDEVDGLANELKNLSDNCSILEPLKSIILDINSDSWSMIEVDLGLDNGVITDFLGGTHTFEINLNSRNDKGLNHLPPHKWNAFIDIDFPIDTDAKAVAAGEKLVQNGVGLLDKYLNSLQSVDNVYAAIIWLYSNVYQYAMKEMSELDCFNVYIDGEKPFSDYYDTECLQPIDLVKEAYDSGIDIPFFKEVTETIEDFIFNDAGKEVEIYIDEGIENLFGICRPGKYKNANNEKCELCVEGTYSGVQSDRNYCDLVPAGSYPAKVMKREIPEERESNGNGYRRAKDIVVSDDGMTMLLYEYMVEYDNNYMFVTRTSYLSKSEDGGITWYDHGQVITTTQSEECCWSPNIVMSASADLTTIVILHQEYKHPGSGVYMSTDGGISWSQLEDLADHQANYMRAIYVDENLQKMVFVDYNDYLILEISPNGHSWTKVSKADSQFSVCAQAASPEKVFALSQDYTKCIYLDEVHEEDNEGNNMYDYKLMSAEFDDDGNIASDVLLDIGKYQYLSDHVMGLLVIENNFDELVFFYGYYTPDYYNLSVTKHTIDGGNTWTNVNLPGIDYGSDNTKIRANSDGATFVAFEEYNTALWMGETLDTFSNEVILVMKEGATQYFECPAGYSSLEGSAECNICTPGYYKTSNDGVVECRICPAGTYSSTDSSECVDCAAGTYSITGSSECVDCAAGTYSSTGSTECVDCAAGTFSFIRAAVCTQCKIGYSTLSSGTVSDSENDSSVCTVCASGFTGSVVDGVLRCDTCPSGFFSLGQTCTGCPAGSYSDVTDAVCIPCAAGKYSTIHAGFCEDCPAGYHSLKGQPLCQLCLPGTFSTSGSSSCTECPMGDYSGPGSSMCQSCSE